jgi:hypothetical protein
VATNKVRKSPAYTASRRGREKIYNIFSAVPPLPTAFGLAHTHSPSSSSLVPVRPIKALANLFLEFTSFVERREEATKGKSERKIGIESEKKAAAQWSIAFLCIVLCWRKLGYRVSQVFNHI